METTGKKGGFRNVIILSIVSFLNDLSSEMIMPILPMFLESLGATGQIVGLVGGIRDSISGILKVLCGYWSDKTGKRKIFVYAGYGISSVFKLLLGLSKTAGGAVVFSSMERVGKGLRTAARDAIIAESVDAAQRGKSFGIHRGMDSAGAVLGAGVAFIFLQFTGLGFSAIIIISAIIGLASLVPLRFVSEPEAPRQNAKLKLSLSILPRPLKLFILVAAIFALGNFSYMFFVLRAQHLFEGNWRTTAPILLYVLFNIFYSALSIPLGTFSDRIGRQKILIFGFGTFAVVSFGFAFCNSLVFYIILFALYGVVFAAVDGTERALVSDLAGPDYKATALGTYSTITGLAALPAGIVAGFLWDKSPVYTFIFGGATAIAAIAVFVIFSRHFTGQKAIKS
ncbi:MAG: MFS transporter [Sedimentisphaerales bacterium]|jgi:MFS family permease